MGALFFLRRPQTIIIFPMRYSSLILLCLLFNFAFTQYYSCSGPCTTRFPQCQEAKCDHALGVCVTEPLDPLPAGCCVSSDDCVSQNPECLVGSCSITTNQCSFDNVCDPPSIFTYGECSRNADCTDDNECTQEFCDTTNGVCVISSIPNSNIPGCCQDRSDCTPSECRIASCNHDTFTCSYRIDTNCNAYSGDNNQPIDGEESSSSPSSSSVSYGQDDQEPYGAPSYIMGIIGILILAFLICCGISLYIITTIQHFINAA